MFLPVLAVIVCITTDSIALDVAANRADSDLHIEDLSGRRIISYPDIDQVRITPRSCTLHDEQCLPICCDPVRYDNRTTCYANASIYSIKDITFSAIPDCERTILNMRPEELVQQRNERFSLGQETQYDVVFYVLENGTIYENDSMNSYEDHWLDLENYYCLTSLSSEDGTSSVEAVCFPSVNDNKGDTVTNRAVTTLYLVSTVVAMPFLLATFLIYTILPRFQNMHGFTFRAFIGSLMAMHTSLIFAHFDRTTFCGSLVFVTYFSSLSCFSWMTVMSFDIWWTFRKYRSVTVNRDKVDRRKWRTYAVFAWGSAAFLTGVCATMQYVPRVPDFLKPTLAIKTCWSSGTSFACAIYYYVPVSVSVIFNVFLFTATINRINQQQKELALYLDTMNSRRHNYIRRRFGHTVKLCTMMIINLSMEITNCLCERNMLRHFWAIMDLTSIVQALTIFVMFVCTDSVKSQLYKHLGFQNGSFSSWSTLRKKSDSNRKDGEAVE